MALEDLFDMSLLSLEDDDFAAAFAPSPRHKASKHNRVSFGMAGEAPKRSRPNGTTPIVRCEFFYSRRNTLLTTLHVPP